MKKTSVVVKHLSKSYGNLQAVRDLSFQVEEGQIFGLLGPNGAGKSTTLACILGVKEADEGNVTFEGTSLKEKKKSLYGRIGVQFQTDFFPERIRVGEMCQMVASLYPETIDWKEGLKQFGLAETIKREVAHLSGGQRQKLSVLLAMLHNPQWIFLDELTTGLDPRARREIWAHLKRLRSQGRTLVMTSHYMEEVAELCDEILVLSRGEEVFRGSVEEMVAFTQKQNLEEAYLALTDKEEMA